MPKLLFPQREPSVKINTLVVLSLVYIATSDNKTILWFHMWLSDYGLLFLIKVHHTRYRLCTSQERNISLFRFRREDIQVLSQSESKTWHQFSAAEEKS